MLAGGVLLVIPSYLVSLIGLVIGGGAFIAAWKMQSQAVQSR